MAAQKGDSVLLKLGDDGSPQTFTAAAGIRSASIAINREQVDVTSADDTSKMRQLLAGAGVFSFSVSGSGVFKSGTVSDNINTIALSGAHRDWQVVVPGLGTFEGKFEIAALTYAGEYNAQATYEITLESAGDIAYTAD